MKMTVKSFSDQGDQIELYIGQSNIFNIQENINKIKSEGYSFQIEVNCLCFNKNYRIIEVPIIFYDRTIGESKMSKKIIIEAIIRVPIFRLRKIFGLL